MAGGVTRHLALFSILPSSFPFPLTLLAWGNLYHIIHWNLTFTSDFVLRECRIRLQIVYEITYAISIRKSTLKLTIVNNALLWDFL